MKPAIPKSLPLWAVAIVLLGGAPWETPRVPTVKSIPGVGGLSAQSCGACHQEIYREWKSSSHAWAWRDAQFQGELHKDPAVGWICLNCHTPATDQQADRVVESGVHRSPAVEKNPSFDARLREDGVGCLTCHWRAEGIAGPHEGVQAPHPVVHDPSLRESSEHCTTCHQAKARLEDALVCHFNTGEEWVEAKPGQPCQGCHMPRVTRSVAPGAPAREGGHHTWFGGGVPKGPVDPMVQPLWDAWEPGYTLSLAAPDSAGAGQTVRVTATLSHARAGHLVPTGDPERHLLVDFKAVSGDEVLGKSQHRIGQKWVWSPVAKQLADNRLKPGESRDYTLEFEMPSAPVDLQVRVTHVRLTQDNWRYHLDLFERDGQSKLAAALRELPLKQERRRAEARITPQ